MNHLFIQIPCLNEEKNLFQVLSQIPKSIDGFDSVSILVIDDGSIDRTSEIASDFGVDHILRFPSNRGLSAAFQAGIDFCLLHGATHIVNTDADNQYASHQIVDLLSKLKQSSADVVIGDRSPGTVREFHPLKRFFQVLGSRITSSLCGVKILDATSGFRAYTAEAASAIFITNPYTYTLESLVQLSFMRFKIEHVLVTKNASTRPSRLFNSTSQYIRKNGLVLLKSYIHFAPMKFFGCLSGFSATFGFLAFIPFIIDAIHGRSQGHLQSLIAGTLFFVTSVQLLSVAFIGDSIRSNRLISQRILQQTKLNNSRPQPA